MKYQLHSTQAMEQFGAQLYSRLPEQCLVFLQGNLGAGKTTLVRGFLRAAGIQSTIKSPTYNLVEEYQTKERHYYHFDLYRLTDPEELEWMGIRDYFEQQAVTFVEWPEMGKGFLPEPELLINLSIDNDMRVLEYIAKNLQLNIEKQ